jgi:guanyl-specific ribonuclease Sa
MKIYAKTINAKNKFDFRPDISLLKKGASEFRNLERSLPSFAPKVIPITYVQYDVKPSYLNTAKGKPRDSQRIIMGSDGKSYYTPNYYESFLRLGPKK